MTGLVLVLLMGVVTYATRAVGFVFARRDIPPAVERFLSFVPVAAFAVLIVPGLELGTSEMWPRLIAGIVGGLVTLRWGALWLTLLVGMGCYWLAGYVL
jgi:branched-subunit amino acid transport protein